MSWKLFHSVTFCFHFLATIGTALDNLSVLPHQRTPCLTLFSVDISPLEQQTMAAGGLRESSVRKVPRRCGWWKPDTCAQSTSTFYWRKKPCGHIVFACLLFQVVLCTYWEGSSCTHTQISFQPSRSKSQEKPQHHGESVEQSPLIGGTDLIVCRL